VGVEKMSDHALAELAGGTGDEQRLGHGRGVL
jgi:hypothetical protein